MNTIPTQARHEGAEAKEADVIDATVTEERSSVSSEAPNEGNWAERAPLTTAFLRKFDAARSALNGQLEAGQKNIDELQRKAADLVSQVQERAGKVAEKVSEEGKEAGGKLEGLRKELGNKLPLRIDLESWLNLPLEARQDVLKVLGIASDKQVSELQASVDKLREETIVLVEAQTAVLKEIIEHQHKPATVPAPTPRKTTARKTTKAKSSARKASATKSTTAKAATGTAKPAARKRAPKAASKVKSA